MKQINCYFRWNAVKTKMKFILRHTQPSLGRGWGIGAPAEAWLQYEWKGLALIVESEVQVQIQGVWISLVKIWFSIHKLWLLKWLILKVLYVIFVPANFIVPIITASRVALLTKSFEYKLFSGGKKCWLNLQLCVCFFRLVWQMEIVSSCSRLTVRLKFGSGRVCYDLLQRSEIPEHDNCALWWNGLASWWVQ